MRGELHIVEIIDPTSPTLVARWDLDDAVDQDGPNFDELYQRRGRHIASCNLHDVWASPDGMTAYLSFWDAGLDDRSRQAGEHRHAQSVERGVG